MKILFITDLYPIKKGESTTPLTLHNFVIEWIKQGHSVDVIKPNFIFNSFLRGKKFYKDGFYEFEGVKIFNVNYFTPFWGNIEIDAKMQRCKDAKQKEDYLISGYDIIIAHMPSGIIFANKLAQKYKKPLVCGVHCSDIEVLTNPLYKFYFKRQMIKAYKYAKKIACRSYVLQKKFCEILPELADKTFVAPSGIERTGNRKWEKRKDSTKQSMSLRGMNEANDEAIQKKNPSPQPSPARGEGESCSPLTSHFSLLTCANLIKRKNIDKLILALKNLDGFELKIIGDGKELKKLKSLSKKVGWASAHQQKINFLGRLSHDKVLEEMQKSDVFILPSVNETFGLVYLEAMASGCIAVCSKNDGIDGIIKEGENGFLCEPTIEGIKQTLMKIKSLENIEEIRRNGIETVKNYTLENCAKNYLQGLCNFL